VCKPTCVHGIDSLHVEALHSGEHTVAVAVCESSSLAITPLALATAVLTAAQSSLEAHASDTCGRGS